MKHRLISPLLINPAVTKPKTSFHFTTYSEAARSNSLSMIYAGWDFRKSVLYGETMERQVSNYVFNNSFQSAE